MFKRNRKRQKVTQPTYSYWQAFFLSFFNRNLYLHVAKYWKGFGIGYLLFALLITTIPFAARIIIETKNFFKQEIFEPIGKIPPFSVKQGQVIFNEPMPYMIRDKADNVVLIIDTTEKSKAMENSYNTYPDLSILITKNKIFYRLISPTFFLISQHTKTNNQIYVQDLEKNAQGEFNGKQLINSSQIKLMKYSFMVFYPLIVSLVFGLYIILFLVFALLGQFIAQLFFQTRLTYKQASRFVMVAATPQLGVFFIFSTVQFHFPHMNWFFMALFATYFCFAVLSLKRANNQLAVK